MEVATRFKSTSEKFRSSFMLSGGSGVLAMPSYVDEEESISKVYKFKYVYDLDL